SPSRDGYVRVLTHIPGSRSATVLGRESVTDATLPGTRSVVGAVRLLGVSADAFGSAQRNFYRFALRGGPRARGDELLQFVLRLQKVVSGAPENDEPNDFRLLFGEAIQFGVSNQNQLDQFPVMGMLVIFEPSPDDLQIFLEEVEGLFQILDPILLPPSGNILGDLSFEVIHPDRMYEIPVLNLAPV